MLNGEALSAMDKPMLQTADITLSWGDKILVHGTDAKLTKLSQFEPVPTINVGAINELARSFFHPDRDYSNMRTLAIRGIFGNAANSEDGAGNNEAFDIICGSAPNLHHLTVDCCGFVPPKALSFPIPPLRTLTLWTCLLSSS